MPINLITILGPTATGKTKLASQLAKEFKGEIISADSRQVYKRMDIGTGKDLNDYEIEGELIPYHLIDIIEPEEEYNLFRFKNDFKKSYEEITDRNKLPFLVGGSGLYLSSILQNYNMQEVEFSEERINKLNKLSVEELQSQLKDINPVLHNTTDLRDKKRIINAIIVSENSSPKNTGKSPINSLNIGISLPRTEIKKKITERLKLRLQNGMVEEVEELIASGITFEKLKFFGLEYKFIALYLQKEINYNDMFQKLNSAIHNFAKRQMTWFKKMEKEGIKINWIEGPDFNHSKKMILKKF
ncbi:MAG TPA: tRNA (adenosine(37)-N6)-dimethylallyltransferase MiaA [Ignavibacteriaceae bacterium]|nr:tRNA (adenosine(37)-N6)-dimethylallyltransferase MiaA [Ignavibacteriaceae bacterium]